MFTESEKDVIILVVVEDGLRGYQIGGHNPLERCLNPCCGGRWSQSLEIKFSTRAEHFCLNPCCGGRWSQRILHIGDQYSNAKKS